MKNYSVGNLMKSWINKHIHNKTIPTNLPKFVKIWIENLATKLKLRWTQKNKTLMLTLHIIDNINGEITDSQYDNTDWPISQFPPKLDCNLTKKSTLQPI